MRIPEQAKPIPHLRWKALQNEAQQLKDTHLYDLFLQDSNRFQHFSLTHGPLLMDSSKEHITDSVLKNLIGLAEDKRLGDWIHRLFAGDKVNASEGRAAMHWALRLPTAYERQGLPETLLEQVHNQRKKMYQLVETLRAGQWRGYSGKVITDLVNIGVGGSDLGPLMAAYALDDSAVCANAHLKHTVPNVHFASSMEGSQIARLLQHLNPETTVFVIASKSFTTQDTLANVETALAWFSPRCDELALIKRCHFIGVSTRADLMQSWGIVPENQLIFWDWVGGRFSLWSAIGLSLAVKIGVEAFDAFLQGAHSMDEHFRTAPFSENMPVLNALIGIWNTNFLNINAHAILPYDGRLEHLPAYLEQLEMESNGKSVCRDGEWVSYRTCPIIWGEVGTNAQHAFYQLLHQGTERVTCDFLLVANRYQEPQYATIADTLKQQHRLGLANGLAQSQLLALGERVLPDADQLPNHKRYQGNQPNTTFILDELSPFALGALLALYEHKVFVQSVIWDINPFDQWGVELGKKLAHVTHDLLCNGGETTLTNTDSSTAGLINHLQRRGQ